MKESIQAMRERRHELIKQARQLANNARDNKGMSDDDEKRFNELLAEADEIEAQIVREQRVLDSEAEGHFAGRPAATGSEHRPDAGRGECWFNTQTGEPIHVLAHGERLAAQERNDTGTTFGSWLRNTIIGWKGDDRAIRGDVSTSGITIPAPLAPEVIDRVRAAMVLSRAGVRTVPMDYKTLTMARITGDPTVAWHAENAALAESDPTFDAVTLTSKTVVALVKFSLELAQDSANFEEACTRSLTSALALAIDQAGLTGPGSATEPGGVSGFANRRTVTAIGAPANYDFLLDGVGALINGDEPLDEIGATILHPRLWTDLAKLKTGLAGDQTTLRRPPAIEQMPLLVTSSCPVTVGPPDTTTAFVGDWSELMMGVRKDIQIVPLREAFLGTNLQVALLVYARVDFQPQHEESFATLEGIQLS